MPTFDVVVIEPNGEGVIAGRAAPGWKVSVQSEGTKVAEAKADLPKASGAWCWTSRCSAGDHALSLKITSPDGTRALSSQESVRVAVGADAKQASAPAGIEGATTAACQAVPQAAAPVLAPSQPAAVEATPPDGNAQIARSRRNAVAARASRDGAKRSGRARASADAGVQDGGLRGYWHCHGTVTLSGVADPGRRSRSSPTTR